jgi:hypothetical protein
MKLWMVSKYSDFPDLEEREAKMVFPESGTADLPEGVTLHNFGPGYMFTDRELALEACKKYRAERLAYLSAATARLVNSPPPE